MYSDKRVIAVVPARSGSKGLPGKNMARIAGVSLIGHAGRCLAELPWLDRAIISTDDSDYAAEGQRHGLESPFLRPAELSSDLAGAVDTMVHAVSASESHYGERYDIVLIVEPTSPLRRSSDIEECVRLLVSSSADSVVTVSCLPKKFHPHKVFALDGGRIGFYEEQGAGVTNRQELGDLFWRNGACYALTRECLFDRRRIITEDSRALVIDRELANIDDPIELEWARFLYAKDAAGRTDEA